MYYYYVVMNGVASLSHGRMSHAKGINWIVFHIIQSTYSTITMQSPTLYQHADKAKYLSERNLLSRAVVA